MSEVSDQENPLHTDAENNVDDEDKIDNMVDADDETEESSTRIPTSHFVALEKRNEITFTDPIFEKVELKVEMDGVNHDDVIISRPVGTTFRVGTEVVVSQDAKPFHSDKVFLFYGMTWNDKDFLYSYCILFHPDTEKCYTAPLQYVARPPNGRAYPDTKDSVQKGNLIVPAWLNHLKENNIPLSKFAGDPAKGKAPATNATSSSLNMNLRVRKAQPSETAATVSQCSPASSFQKEILHQLGQVNRSIAELNKKKNSKSDTANNAAIAKYMAENARMAEEIKGLRKENSKLIAQHTKDEQHIQTLQNHLFGAAQNLAAQRIPSFTPQNTKANPARKSGSHSSKKNYPKKKRYYVLSTPESLSPETSDFSEMMSTPDSERERVYYDTPQTSNSKRRMRIAKRQDRRPNKQADQGKKPASKYRKYKK